MFAAGSADFSLWLRSRLDDRYIKMNSIDDTLPLELYPDAISADTRESQIKLNLRGPIGKKWMGMDHVDQVVAGRQHMTPGAQILLEAFSRTDRKAHLSVRPGNRLSWNCGQLDFQVLAIF